MSLNMPVVHNSVSMVWFCYELMISSNKKCKIIQFSKYFFFSFPRKLIPWSQWYTVQHLLSNKCCKCCSTNVEQCIMWCWMLKYAVQHVESCWTSLNENRAWHYSVQQVAACWTASTNRFRVWCHVVSWKYQHGGRRVGNSSVRLEFW